LSNNSCEKPRFFIGTLVAKLAVGLVKCELLPGYGKYRVTGNSMNHEIYAALSGALANDRRQEVTANNLANINSGGFRRDVPLFKTVYDQVSGSRRPLNGAAAVEHNAFAVHDGNWIDFQTGDLQDTGNPLDVALDGEGFFALKRASDGTIYYTRDGHFRINEEQELVSINGEQVLAAGGADAPLVLTGENPGPAQNIKISIVKERCDSSQQSFTVRTLN